MSPFSQLRRTCFETIPRRRIANKAWATLGQLQAYNSPKLYNNSSLTTAALISSFSSFGAGGMDCQSRRLKSLQLIAMPVHTN